MGLQYSDYENIREARYGLYAALDASDKQMLDYMLHRSFHIHQTNANVGPLDTDGEQMVLVPETTIRVLSASFICSTNIPADDFDTVNLNLVWYPPGGGPFVVVTSYYVNNANGPVTANVAYPVALTAPSANWVIPAGSVVVGGIVKIGAGVIIGRADLQFNYELVRL